MATQTDREARQFAERLLDLKETSQFNATATQVRASTTWLRDAHDNYERLWSHVGLTGSPTVSAYRLMVPVTPSLTAFVYQAEEAPASREQEEAYMASMGVPPEIIAQNIASILPIGGGDWYLSGISDDGPITLETNVYARQDDLLLADFFGLPFVVIGGFAISRFDVLNYGAYEKGYIHTDGSRNRKKYPEQTARLRWFDESKDVFRRPNVEYMIMDCSRALATSQDASRYVEAASL